MPAKRSRKPAPSRGRAARSRARGTERGGKPSSNGSRSRAGTGSSRGVAGRIEEFTRLLLEERKRLRQELSEMEEHQVKTEEKPVVDAANEDDLVDVATEAFEREKELALESSVQGILEMVEEALQRVRDGTYGICNGCGKTIDGNRLRAIPYARLCIKCKEREERQRIVVR
jgi:RNA polymerase-binding protein DksA